MTSIEAFIQDFIKSGVRYSTSGEPGTLDCWSFSRKVQKDLFGRDLPSIQLDDGDISNWIKLVIRYRGQLNWVPIEKPQHGCIVEMGHHSRPYHIGTWLDIEGGKVIHFSRAGFLFQSLTELKMSGWRRFIYDIPAY